MFKWMRSFRRGGEPDVVPEPRQERDSGEDVYESEEEEDREVSPSAMTRAKTDNI